ncbi:hypothetical protein AB0E96_19475 [Kitasatospora sp. NPDC036755]|uniref:hypothetical protein n=1 Tax=Kitasatospora sp. NPDC036755 TaxID=3154600 RepID=UPI00340AF821
MLYRHDGERVVPAAHVTALLRHVAETVRIQRTRGEVPLDLVTTAQIYTAVVTCAADLDPAIAAADADGGPAAPGLPGPPATVAA